MRVEADGPVPCDLMLVAEAPGHEEQFKYRELGFKKPTPLIGKAGQQLWADMERICGLTRKDIYSTNVVKEGLPNNRDPKPAEIGAALPELFEELEGVHPKFVVTAGGFATRVFLGGPLSYLHGIPYVVGLAGHTYTVMPIYHPAAGLHQKGFLSAFSYDLTQLRALLQKGLRSRLAVDWRPSKRLERVRVAPGTVRWLRKPSELPRFPKGAVYGIDTEGWVDKPWGLSFTLDGAQAFVIPSDATQVLRAFQERIDGHTAVFHNGLHDFPVLGAVGVTVDLANWHDTQVLAYHEMLRTGSGVLEAESQNLGCLAYRQCGLHLGELADCEGVDLEAKQIPYTDQVRDYAGMDAIATWRLFHSYSPELQNSEPYHLDMGQIPLVSRMVDSGVPFDLGTTFDFYADVSEKLKATTAALRKEAADYGNHDFNPGSHPQVRELLTQKIGLRVRKRTPGGLVSTGQKALVHHVDHPFVAALQTYRELQKLSGTYLVPLLEELCD